MAEGVLIATTISVERRRPIFPNGQGGWLSVKMSAVSNTSELDENQFP